MHNLNIQGFIKNCIVMTFGVVNVSFFCLQKPVCLKVMSGVHEDPILDIEIMNLL